MIHVKLNLTQWSATEAIWPVSRVRMHSRAGNGRMIPASREAVSYFNQINHQYQPEGPKNEVRGGEEVDFTKKFLNLPLGDREAK